MKYVAVTMHMVRQKAWIGVPLGCLAQFALVFFPVQITKVSQKSKLPLLKKGGGEFTVKFSFIARANVNGLSGYNGWSIQMS